MQKLEWVFGITLTSVLIGACGGDEAKKALDNLGGYVYADAGYGNNVNPITGDGGSGSTGGNYNYGDGSTGGNYDDGDGSTSGNYDDGGVGNYGDGGTGDGDTAGSGNLQGGDTAAPTADTASKAGSLTVGSYTNGYRDGPDFADATIWYPKNGTPPYAGVAIVPGWVSSQGDISQWGPFLASHGLAVITIGTNSPLTDLPADREAAVMDALVTLKAENDRSGSPLQGALDTSHVAVMGWSMGGGGVLRAGADHPELKAVVAMCPWDHDGTGSDGLHLFPNETVPSLLFGGTLDALAGGQQQPFYNSIPASTPKLWYEINGADHWIANDPAHENGLIGRFGLSWLKTFLVGDSRYKQFLTQKPSDASNFEVSLP
jgi:dienelactone hydrolase